MPGIFGRVGGRRHGDATAVAALLEHFPFYGAAEVGDERAWLGWAGIGDPAARLRTRAADGLLAAYHGDGAGGDAAVAAARLDDVVALAAGDPLRLAERIDGSFVAAVCDPAAGRATIVGDVFGHHRLYWCVRDGALYFASELKGLLGWADLAFAPDDDALRDILNYSYPLGDRTSLQGVRVLPPASVLTFAAGQARVAAYWTPVYEPTAADPARLAEQGYELFARAFSAKVAAGRDVVVPVSGGLDSRMLLGEAVQRGHRVTAYTYGHGSSREAQVARAVMAAGGVGDRFHVMEDFPEPESLLARTSWFVEGQSNLSLFPLTAVNDRMLDVPRRNLFLNGIYGGPTNFSSIYHKPNELVTDPDLDERVRRVGRTMFSDRMDSAQARFLLRPDFARRCSEAYWPQLRENFVPWQRVSPVFGHQKDAFLVANRLFRFMNQVDLNRYFWDECMPLTSFSLYRFYLRLPEEVKFDRRLHRRIIADRFPRLAAQVNFNTGRTVVEDLAGVPPVAPSARAARLRHLAGRLTLGRLSLADPESYQAVDHHLRRNRRMREFVGDQLADPRWRSGAWFDQKRVLDYVGRTRRGVDLSAHVMGVLAWELWLRQLETRSKEVS